MVSIIIPCYNAEANLDATIASVQAQTSGDWEIVAIDDGSADATYVKLQKLAAEDKRIRVIHQENQGVSASRNNGIRNAVGDIIYFLDSDDLIEPGLVDKLEREFKDNPDMAIFGFRLENSDGSISTHIPKSDDRMELLRMFLTNRSPIHICSGAYSRKFLEENKLRFDIATAYSEDREFVCYALFAACKVKVIKIPYYTYKWYPDSIMRRKIYDEKKFSSVLACERMYHRLAGSEVCKEALIQLKTTILLHFRFHQKYNLEPNHATALLSEKAGIYLKKLSPLRMQRDALYASVMGAVYVYFPLLYRQIVKII